MRQNITVITNFQISLPIKVKPCKVGVKLFSSFSVILCLVMVVPICKPISLLCGGSADARPLVVHVDVLLSLLQ